MLLSIRGCWDVARPMYSSKVSRQLRDRASKSGKTVSRAMGELPLPALLWRRAAMRHSVARCSACFAGTNAQAVRNALGQQVLHPAGALNAIPDESELQRVATPAVMILHFALL